MAIQRKIAETTLPLPRWDPSKVVHHLQRIIDFEISPVTEKTRVLITGASGLLGSNLVRHYSSHSECTGWYGNNPVNFADATTLRMDITDRSSTSRAIQSEQPNLIIHCAAATDVEWCERNPERAKSINEDATQLLAEAAAAIGAKFVFISTDSVFDGIAGNYSESDTPQPLNSYAAGKVRMESVVASVNPEALIIRSYFYGHSPAGTRSLLEWVLTRALAGNAVPGFTDSHITPISVLDFATSLDAAIESKSSGLLHLGSKDSISKFEFARLVMERYNCDMSLLRPISVDDAGLNANRPRDTSLDVQLLESILGRPAPTVRDGIDQIADLSAPFR